MAAKVTREEILNLNEKLSSETYPLFHLNCRKDEEVLVSTDA